MSKIEAKTIEALEANLRSGDQSSVREFLRKVSRNEIPDRFVLRVSQLARRADFAKKGLLLLRDRVIDLPSNQSADPNEQAEYAACLLKLGGFTEAARMLKTISHSKSPEALKYLAFAYFHQWDYESAIPLLENYVSLPEVPAYERLVGSLNLSAALVSIERYFAALSVLNQIREQAEVGGHKLILGNIHELMAQAHIHSGDFASATKCLELSWNALALAQPRYRLYLRKWRAVSQMLQNPSDPSGAKELREIRREAIACSEWETARECDLYESLLLRDEEMFLRLYFGTPHAPYRAKMLRKSEGFVSIPKAYAWGPKESARTLDLNSALSDNGDMVVKKSQALHRTLMALSFDFYAPATVPQLFCQIFESERFHPQTSAHRIYELVRRLKSALEKDDIYIPIEAVGRGYLMRPPEGNCQLVIQTDRTSSAGLLANIKAMYGGGEFLLRDLSERIGVPHTTVYRELKRLVSEGEIVSEGNGKRTRYRCAQISNGSKRGSAA